MYARCFDYFSVYDCFIVHQNWQPAAAASHARRGLEPALGTTGGLMWG